MTTRDSLDIQEERAELARMKREIDSDPRTREQRLAEFDLQEETEIHPEVSAMDEALILARVRNQEIDSKNRQEALDLISAGLADLMASGGNLNDIQAGIFSYIQQMNNAAKQPINIRLDSHTLRYFKIAAFKSNAKYQTLINKALNEYVTNATKRDQEQTKRA